MVAANLHVVTHEEEWAIQREGHETPVSTHGTQREAIDEATKLAEADGSNVVIHRTDGRIRDVRSYDDSNGTATENRNGRAVVPSSLTSRVRWGAIFAGLVVTLTSGLTLGVLGVALGLCLTNLLSPENLKIFAGVWTSLTLLASLFVGGMIVTRLTVGENQVCEPTIYGMLLWGLAFLLLPFLPMTASDLGFGQVRAAANEQPTINKATLVDAGLTDEQVSKVVNSVEQTPTMTSLLQNSATEAAWLTFAAIIISLGAAVGGAVVGAQLEDPKTTVATA